MKVDAIYLRHVLDAIQQVELYTTGGRERFDKERMIQDAVMRNLEIIGEAVKHVSEESRDLQPDIPWKQIAGMRDVLIHNDFGVKLDTVWEVVAQHLTPLRDAVEAMLQADDRDE